MAGDPKPVLGYIQCGDCGERGTVHESAGRRAGYLYKRCGCGCDQRNGKMVQSVLWYEAQWLDVDQLPEGVELPNKPPNVYDLDEYQERRGGVPEKAESDPEAESIGQETSETAEAEAANEPDFEPEEAENIPETEPVVKPKKSNTKKWLGGAALLVLSGLAFALKGGK